MIWIQEFAGLIDLSRDLQRLILLDPFKRNTFQIGKIQIFDFLSIYMNLFNY